MKKLLKFASVLILFISITGFSVRIFVETSAYSLSKMNLKKVVERWAMQDYTELQKLWNLDLRLPIYITINEPSKEWRGESFLSVNAYNIILSSDPQRLRKTLTHEMMHVFNFEWDLRNNVKTPLWVMEGIACWWEAKKRGQRREISPLIVLNGKMLDVVNVFDYPQGDKVSVFYSAVEDLFFRVDKVIDLKKNFLGLFKDAKISGWETAFSDFLGTNFNDFYKRWKLELFFISFLKLLYFNIPWFIILFIMAILFIIKSKVRNRDFDDLSELERIYGKNYWMSKGNDN